jgi:hypothetical protein
MPRRLAPEKLLELDSLARVLGVIAAYTDTLMAGPARSETLAAVVATAYAEKNLRGLRIVQGDLLAMTAAMTAAQRRELDSRLRGHAGVSLLSLLARQRERVARLRTRGKLTSEQQYYLVREHIELLMDDPAHAAELTEFRGMLEDFDLRAANLSKSIISTERSNDR